MPFLYPRTRDEIDTAAQAWLHWLETERHAPPETVKTWRSSMNCWLRLLPPDPTRDDISRALERRLPRDRKAVRCTTYYCTRAFYAWWHEHGGPPFPLAAMKPPKHPKVRRAPLTEADIDLAIERALRADPKGRAMVLTIICTGARVSDIVNLLVEDVDLANGSERIRFRNRKAGESDEWLPLEPLAAEAIARYLDEMRLPSAWYLFPGLKGMMVTKSVWKTWRRVVGIGMPHQARHFFGTWLLRHAHADIENVRVLLGHADIRATETYLHADLGDARSKVIQLGDRLRRATAAGRADQAAEREALLARLRELDGEVLQ